MFHNAQVIAIVGLAGRFPGAPDLAALAAGTAVPQEGSEPASGDGWRLLVDRAWEALQGAGSAVRDAERAGLFAGLGTEASPADDGALAAAARELGLGGPAAAAAEPSSPAAAAVRLACESLRRGECDLALAGAVGEGAGVAVLKRLASALAEGDRVLGVVRGTAILPPSPPPLAAQAAAPCSVAAAREAPRMERPALATEYAPPGNPLEAAIAAVWEKQLGVDRIGVQDSFFELGGNSLQGTQILALLRGWLEQEIPTVSLYEGPTVAALARVILQGGGGGARRGYDAVRERGERRRRKLQRLAQEAAEAAAE